MSDLPHTVTVDELAARLAALEARLPAAGVSPLAAAPPVTIGELTDVPAPGSPIASAWAQEVTRRCVHRFATIAARDTAYPAAGAGAGAVCFTADHNVYWISNGAAWSLVSPMWLPMAGLTPSNTPPNTEVVIARATMPFTSDIRIHAQLPVSSTGSGKGELRAYTGSTKMFVTTFQYTNAAFNSVFMMMLKPTIGAGSIIELRFWCDPAGTAFGTFNDPLNNSTMIELLPKGYA